MKEESISTGQKIWTFNDQRNDYIVGNVIDVFASVGMSRGKIRVKYTNGLTKDYTLDDLNKTFFVKKYKCLDAMEKMRS